MAAKIVNLSVGGGLLVLDAPHQSSVGRDIEVAFTVNHLPFRARAQVRAVRSATSLGLRFEMKNARTRRDLEELVEELAADKRKCEARKLATLRYRAAIFNR
jgi:hypothetical protein